MKAKPVLTIALAVTLCGGLLLAFPTLWMFLLLVLLGLISAQASLIQRNLRVISRDAAGKAFSLSAPPVMHAPPASAPQPVQDVSAVLNRELFSRFRQHLESAEDAPARTPGPPPAAAVPATPAAPAAIPGKPPSPPPTGIAPATRVAGAAAPQGTPEHLAVDGVSDQVVLSGAAKAGASKVKPRPTYPPNPRPKPAPEPEKEEDWFADLRPTPPGAAASKKPVPAPPPSAAPDSGPPVAGQDEEAATLLKLAEDALQRGDVSAAKAAMGHYVSLMQAHGAAVPWNARRAQVRLAMVEQDAPAALEAFEAMLKEGYEVKEEAVPALLDQLIAGAKADVADPLRVSMLLRVLAQFRQNKDRAAMDRLYRLLEEAQERVGDERKLVQFLKNHLEIKKVMGETAGQVDLIDQIGNRLFKLGETAAAREYYEMGLKLRAELQQQAQPASEAKSGTTTQTA